MNSREIVNRTLDFKYPERIPLMFEIYQEPTDILNPYIGTDDRWNPDMPKWGVENKPGKYIDEWGCVWEVLRDNEMGQVTYNPLKDLKKIKDFRFPDPYANGRFKEVYNLKHNEKYILFWSFCTLFERAYMLHGFSETLMDLKNNLRQIEELLDVILDFQLKLIESMHRKNIPVNGIGIGDDWGSEHALFISPELWSKIFKERYKKLIDFCHKHGYHVWLHSDGKINDIMEDLIEIELDAINLMSPELLGVEEIGKKYRGKIAFFSSIDHQKTLAFGSEKEMRRELEKLIINWGSEKGGLVLYFCDGNAQALGISNERQRWIVDIIREYTNYYSK